MSYKVKLGDDAKDFFRSISEKSKRIVRKNLDKLKENPYSGKRGDKEKLRIKVNFDNKEYDLYRIHIGRTYTVFYVIDEKEKWVKITELMTIEKAHKMYGRL